MEDNVLVKHLESRIGEMLEFCRELVEHESPSTDRDAVNRFSAFLARVFEAEGATVEVFAGGDHGDNLRVEYGEGQDQVLILCHMDTVWPVGEVARRPFRIEDGKVWGPGIYDMKAGFLYTLEAIRAIKRFGIKMSHRIVLICNSDEEIGSTSSRALIESEAKKSKFVLVLEPSVRGGGLKTSRKGQGTYNLRITGVSAHSGSDPERGVSAVEELARHILTLHSLTDFGTGTTVNVGVISGGTRSNVVAAEAVADIDVRVPNQTEMRKVESTILSLKPSKPGLSVTVTGGMTRPPMERSESIARLFAEAKELAAEIGFELTESSTGAGSDGNFTAALGVPTLDGLGAVGDGSHALHEHMVIEAIPQRIALLVKLVTELG
ncbi:MAG: M20 family metallopeptidase [Bacillota bacterium]